MNQYVIVYNNNDKIIVEVPEGGVFSLGPGIPGSKGPWMFRIYADAKRKVCVFAVAATAFRRSDIIAMSPKDMKKAIDARDDVERTKAMMNVVETAAKEIKEPSDEFTGRGTEKRYKGAEEFGIPNGEL